MDLTLLETILGLCFSFCCASQQLYSLIDGSLCINSEFVESNSNAINKVGCGAVCNLKQRCQAFSLADGSCQLFVFDKCSKSVRNCSCSRTGQVFVKQQLGLLAGSLCPPGYGMDLCGVKYRLYTGIGTWQPSRQKCESDSGLVIMADVISAKEMSHVEMIYSTYSSGQSIWLGGFQPAGSPEPSGGWYWVGCNTTVDASLWNITQPDNSYSTDNAIGRHSAFEGLSDINGEFSEVSNVLCEGVSPFA